MLRRLKILQNDKSFQLKRFAIIIGLITANTTFCTNPLESSNKSIANAGDDQVTYVGSYAVLNPSKSIIIGDTVERIEWVQDSSNPEEVNALGLSLQEPTIVGFVKEGTYRFTLKIICKSGNIFSDDVLITVNPRQVGLIEDENLEVRIRYILNFKEGNLDANKLFMLDSLLYCNFSTKHKITSINGINNCQNLIYLALPNESITDLAPLSNLTKLKFIDLNQNYTINDITPIYNLVNVEKLILYSNPISDISGLGSLNKLKELWLLDTPISDISVLSSLENLEILYADGVGTGISFNSIEPLKNLTKLTHLDISGRGITDIKPLENCTNLVLLGISYNSITEISSISNMKKLIRLYVRSNKITDLNGIMNLENLDFLDAADNLIIDISDLEYLPNIHLIGLSGNKIVDILPIVNNSNLGEGVHLFLNENPLNEKSINEYIPVLISRGVQVSW
ncbi:leucine-rich repeat domain-containing protein [Ignavibacterium sp.]|uniref:leucine-rich repeat domain-containing protein n=1 Tax=Ignavibacterium sp. TaxID=2651167 RepID=UPI00307F915C